MPHPIYSSSTSALTAVNSSSFSKERTKKGRGLRHQPIKKRPSKPTRIRISALKYGGSSRLVLIIGEGAKPLKAAIPAANLERAYCGQSGLVHPQLLLTQHLLARAARKFWRRSIFHQSSRSNGSTASDLRLTFRCAVHELTCRGQTGLMQARLLLTQQ